MPELMPKEPLVFYRHPAVLKILSVQFAFVRKVAQYKLPPRPEMSWDALKVKSLSGQTFITSLF